MDKFMDKLSQKKNAQEMIQANTAADTAKMEQLQHQIAEYDTLLQDMRKVNLKITENMEQMQKVIQESLQKIEAIKESGDTQIDKEELLTEIKKQMEEAFRQSDDFLHKENVKVYRNVQAAVAEELTKQTDVLVAKQRETAGKQKALLPVSIIVMLLVLVDIAVNLFNIVIKL